MTKTLEAAKILGRVAYDDEDQYVFDGDVTGEIAVTHDTVADFIDSQGEPAERETDEETGREVLTWNAGGRGRKYDLRVVDMGEIRVAAH